MEDNYLTSMGYKFWFSYGDTYFYMKYDQIWALYGNGVFAFFCQREHWSMTPEGRYIKAPEVPR